MMMDKLALACFALFLACLAAMQESKKKGNIQTMRTFAFLAVVCFGFAVVFLVIAFLEQSAL